MHSNICIIGLIALSGCSVAPFQLNTEAANADWQKIEVSTGRFHHLVFKSASSSKHQVVFIEGDGRPWTDAGDKPATDPSPRSALAFELMRKTPATSFYLTRPCYFGAATDACTPELWTSARYSEDVVKSMQTALERVLEPDTPSILVGHSGGGTLAMLIAPRLDQAIAVVTVAGLLDTDAWTAYHAYDPLSESINPVNMMWNPALIQIHLIGQQDNIVPSEQSEAAIGNWPGAQIWKYANFDHVCCWVRDWPEIWSQITAALGQPMGRYR